MKYCTLLKNGFRLSNSSSNQKCYPIPKKKHQNFPFRLLSFYARAINSWFDVLNLQSRAKAIPKKNQQNVPLRLLSFKARVIDSSFDVFNLQSKVKAIPNKKHQNFPLRPLSF
jgi:hypothetical protein